MMNQVQNSQNFEMLGNISMIRIPKYWSNLAIAYTSMFTEVLVCGHALSKGGTMFKLVREMRTNSRKKGISNTT